MTINCFSLDYQGLSVGLPLTFNKLGYGGWKLPVHLAVGARFVQCDKHRGCHHETGVVYQAMPAVHRTGTGREFYTLQAPSGDSGQFLVFLDNSMPAQARLKVEPLRSSFETTGRIIERDSNQALVTLEEGQSITTFFPDGKVTVVVCSDQSVVEVKLTPSEMAEVWINQARHALGACPDDERTMKRRHGIIWNIIKLLRLRPTEEVCGSVMDFLRECKEQGFLSQTMSGAAKEAFAACEQMLFAFEVAASGSALGTKIVSLQNHRGPSKDQLAKQTARSAADRDFRNRQKGPTNGQKKKA